MHTCTAFPTADPVVSAQTIYSVRVGMTAIIDCQYKAIGVFRNSYSVKWVKGVINIDPSLPEFSRYRVLTNFSLVITDTKPSDASDVYACHVTVSVTRVMTLYGSPVSLEIRGVWV